VEEPDELVPLQEEPDKQSLVELPHLPQELPAEEVKAAPQDPQSGHHYNVVIDHNVAAAVRNVSASVHNAD
jgi:hypothetical protein